MDADLLRASFGPDIMSVYAFVLIPFACLQFLKCFLQDPKYGRANLLISMVQILLALGIVEYSWVHFTGQVRSVMMGLGSLAVLYTAYDLREYLVLARMLDLLDAIDGPQPRSTAQGRL